MIELITKLERDGSLKQLIKGGFVSTKLLKHYEVYLEFDKQRRTTNKDITQIVTELEDQFKLCERSIYRIIKVFKA